MKPRRQETTSVAMERLRSPRRDDIAAPSRAHSDNGHRAQNNLRDRAASIHCYLDCSALRRNQRPPPSCGGAPVRPRQASDSVRHTPPRLTFSNPRISTLPPPTFLSVSPIALNARTRHFTHPPPDPEPRLRLVSRVQRWATLENPKELRRHPISVVRRRYADCAESFLER